ncbi:glycolipid 2-alpha-mannosyltransferase-domain-containing protein [Mycena metata]|uniref:Glycolipid 2-alpha-mannosyltransferase-domain-containing protein n=1 Tax=Mycena metata TaxID=1033252 RepID=A0AAD7MU55_9AGAR|nr:glycolipid 2-alpha-mannosyltransferase-domain-containing protein [Mycena metata]
MHTAPRYLLIVLAVVISGHYLLSFTTTSYPRFLSSSNGGVNPNAKNNVPMEYYYSQVINSTHTLELANRKRANATFVILARNSDLDSTVRSVREMEDRFNTRHGYPFVLLNDEPFTEEFKRRLNAVASGEVFYGQVPKEHWVQPDWVDEDRATKGREQLVADNVIYGGSVSYRNMCRFNSGCVSYPWGYYSPSFFCGGRVSRLVGGRESKMWAEMRAAFFGGSTAGLRCPHAGLRSRRGQFRATLEAYGGWRLDYRRISRAGYAAGLGATPSLPYSMGGLQTGRSYMGGSHADCSTSLVIAICLRPRRPLNEEGRCSVAVSVFSRHRPPHGCPPFPSRRSRAGSAPAERSCVPARTTGDTFCVGGGVDTRSCTAPTCY